MIPWFYREKKLCKRWPLLFLLDYRPEIAMLLINKCYVIRLPINRCNADKYCQKIVLIKKRSIMTGAIIYNLIVLSPLLPLGRE